MRALEKMHKIAFQVKIEKRVFQVSLCLSRFSARNVVKVSHTAHTFSSEGVVVRSLKGSAKATVLCGLLCLYNQ